jgi:hypothetical protein
VQGLTCKWVSAQEPRLMGYNIQELDQDCIMFRFSWTQSRLNLSRLIELKQQRKMFLSVNHYNGSVIVITVHLNTQKYSNAENSQRNQSVSLCNDSVIVTTIYESITIQ